MRMQRPEVQPGVVTGLFHQTTDNGRVRCEVCPRYCTLKDGQRGFCFVRQGSGDDVVLTAYGRSTGFCIDPIEKKPLNHFYPGSSVLSFGTAGCNLGCRFCQNWDISKAREVERLSSRASPEAIAAAAAERGCRSIAFTYNDPAIFLEYAIDTAQAAHAWGLDAVAVTAGYMTPHARRTFFEHIDAANIDLKAFTERFYKKLCFAELEPVLETLLYLRDETNVWFEVTTLLIPGYNDSEDEVGKLADWMMEHLGPDVPLHFSAFHPDFKMRDVPHTPASTLSRARAQARAAGLRHVYTGNVHDTRGGSTYCPSCETPLIERDWFELGAYRIEGGACASCGTPIAGRFSERAGSWGRRRQRVEMR